MAPDASHLAALPWPCKSRMLSMLPLRDCLCLAAVSRELRDLVRELNNSVVSVDFNELPGTRVRGALAWTLRNELAGLRGISASGAACLEAIISACTLQPEGLLLEGSLQPRLQQLTSLSLDSLKQLQDSHLALVLPHCPNLEVLALPRCSKLTDAAAIAVGARLPRLRVVVCRDWPCLTDVGVAAMAAGCPLLEDVTLDGCLRVGTESLSLLARSCRGLRRLSIAKSYAVTDGALAALGEWCGALEEVVVRQCPRVAAAGHLAACGRLAAVDFSGCSRVSGILDESGTLDLVTRVRRARPSCTLHW
ncbi:F-box/LRR-repeat protein 20 [Tetrabaena socialis]|uniref:F-box/LRR-repeat protein 20 n=1 Tax=Tetrabaena socialis TaxID=47790 RepID=A0A2J7ZWS0_9CHLO|nr:F-box/LRR-repeat protein 20 [Tetrabaena socialis]|eukprot:PNH04723.1 F-box/LRR-repeat protein 20 [Tetrabaena socialis]